MFCLGILENEKIPLAEEKLVRGLLALKPAYQHIEWMQLKTRSLTSRQEVTNNDHLNTHKYLQTFMLEYYEFV